MKSNSLAYLKTYLRPQRRRLALMGLLLLAEIAMQLINPQVIRYFLDTAQAGAQAGAADVLPRLWQAAALYIGLALLIQAMGVFNAWLTETAAWSATNHLRLDLVRHLLNLDMPFFKQHPPGELIQRVDGDTANLAGFFSSFILQALGNALLVLGILVSLFIENAWLGLALTVYTLLVLLVLGLLQNASVKRWIASEASLAEIYAFLEERIPALEDLRLAAAEGHTLRHFGELQLDNWHKFWSALLVNNLMDNLTQFIFALGYALGLALGALLYLRGEASLGAAYLIIAYIGMLATPLQTLRKKAQELQVARASIFRLGELFAAQPQVSDIGQSAGSRLPPGPLGVAFENIDFHYDADTLSGNGAAADSCAAADSGGENGAQDADLEAGSAAAAPDRRALRQISFTLQPGRVLGVLGRTGSGKTTLTRLLFRLYDPGSGAIRVGGLDSRQVSLSELRGAIGLVTQDVQLFAASLRDNLTFFTPGISDERLWQALDDLGLADWVRTLPGGLDTPLQSGGQGFSAGEAQLLAFTRLFLKDPGLVILDEASSRLDPATEALLENAIRCLLSGRSGIVIAHRLGTVQRADDILILEEGRVVEFGERQALAADPHSRFAALLQTGLEQVLA